MSVDTPEPETLRVLWRSSISEILVNQHLSLFSWQWHYHPCKVTQNRCHEQIEVETVFSRRRPIGEDWHDDRTQFSGAWKRPQWPIHVNRPMNARGCQGNPWASPFHRSKFSAFHNRASKPADGVKPQDESCGFLSRLWIPENGWCQIQTDLTPWFETSRDLGKAGFMGHFSLVPFCSHKNS